MGIPRAWAAVFWAALGQERAAPDFPVYCTARTEDDSSNKK
jgi:hypothetical protein